MQTDELNEDELDEFYCTVYFQLSIINRADGKRQVETMYAVCSYALQYEIGYLFYKDVQTALSPRHIVTYVTDCAYSSTSKYFVRPIFFKIASIVTKFK